MKRDGRAMSFLFQDVDLNKYPKWKNGVAQDTRTTEEVFREAIRRVQRQIRDAEQTEHHDPPV
jgi:hypothetical protein